MTLKTTEPELDARLQAAIGVGLAICVLVAWLGVHIFGVFIYELGWHSVAVAPLLVALSCWLYVGLFIVAHDCMHGSLVPFHAAANRLIGSLCLLLYAGFSFDDLNRKHHLHHRHSGTGDDPDFDERPPHNFLMWYLKFLSEYFSWRAFLFLSAVSAIYIFLLDVRYANLLVFWALPAILSSVQLFFFGTYLPHRPGVAPFPDRHRARSNTYNWWASLLSCFHFGHHHEHHLHPRAPWWRLPYVQKPD